MTSSQFDIIELSHVICAGMETYPGLPAPRLEVLTDYEASRPNYQGQAEFFIANYHLCGNTGTYIDAPIHRHRGADDLAALPLERTVHVPVVLVDASRAVARGLGPEWFENLALPGTAVLVRTDWSRFFGTPAYAEPNPHLTAPACELLVRRGVAIVGIDSINIDDRAEPPRPAHTLLLAAGIPIVEHLTGLSALRGEREFFHAAPIAWRGGASFPVRAYVLRERNCGPSRSV
jgi:arylformamidase